VKLSPAGWFKEGQRDLMVFGFVCGLQGKEIVQVDITGFLKYLEVVSREHHPECPHLVVPWLGWLKGEMGKRHHMVILA
jgi:hypothetical protein